MNGYIEFSKGPYATWRDLQNKDPEHVYFATDTGQLFMGDVEYSTKTFTSLFDVDVTSLANGDLIKYDANSSKFKNFVANYIEKSQTVGLVKNDGTIDTSSYIAQSSTEGLVKNNGSIDTTAYAKQSEMSITPGTGSSADKTTIQLKSGTAATVLTQHQDISSKADKVTTGTPNGMLASLNETGNLANSGVMADMTSAPATGNPLSFTTDSAQVAQNTVITFEPIQAGSGDPSPSNEREISGYVKAKLTVPRANVWDGEYEEGTIDVNGNKTPASGSYRSKNDIYVISNTTYYITSSAWNSIVGYDSNGNYIGACTYSAQGSGYVVNIPANCHFIRIVFGANVPSNVSVNYPSTVTTYEPYNPLTDISEQLPTTLYGFKLNVESGELVVDRKIKAVNGTESGWSTIGDGNSASVMIPDMADVYYGDGISNWLKTLKSNSELSQMGIRFGNSNKYIYCYNVINSISGVTDLATWKTYLSNNNLIIIYPIEPITYHLTPHQVKLLQGANTVTTNGTSISLTYRKGELAKLSDLNGIAESVEGTFNKIVYDVNANVRAIKAGNIVTLLISKNISNAVSGWHQLATLPEAFRPSRQPVYFCGMDDSATSHAGNSPINSMLSTTGVLACYIFSDKTSINYRASLTFIC